MQGKTVLILIVIILMSIQAFASSSYAQEIVQDPDSTDSNPADQAATDAETPQQSDQSDTGTDSAIISTQPDDQIQENPADPAQDEEETTPPGTSPSESTELLSSQDEEESTSPETLLPESPDTSDTLSSDNSTSSPSVIEPGTNTPSESANATDTQPEANDIQAQSSSILALASSAYNELCTTTTCSANLICKRDLWTPESTCCNANECSGNNACYTEYSCVSGPTKLCYNGGWIDVLNYEVNCVDGIDNDCDGIIDRADSDCYVPPVCGNSVCETGEDKTTCPADCGGDRYIIIRNDDIAPWWSTDNEIYVTEYIRNMSIPVSIGIIPTTMSGSIKLGDDTKLVDYLTSLRNDPNVEISIHGLTHGTSEFQGIGKDASLSKINEAKNMIKTAISVEPVTFIPPYYEYDTDTLNAANDAGMDYFSAGWNSVDLGHAFKESPAGLMNTPTTTDIYNWGTGTFYTMSEIQSSCENAMARFGTCVIVVHHQLFVDQNNNIDPNKIATLNNIMQWVKSKESTGVKLKTIGNQKLSPLPTPQKKYIVFRNDDIAAYWDTDVVISVTELIRSKNVPQVLGLVPMNEGDMLSDDPDLNNYLKSISTDNSFEFALHGYDHAENEFASPTYEEALTKITDGTSALMTVVGKAPRTFVPPYNVYNDNTMVAIATVFKTLNPEAVIYMSTLSSGSDDTESGKAFKISVVSNSSQILHLPQTTDFYNWDTNSFYTTQEIENSCDSALSTYNICIITLHTQTFTTGGKVDPNKIKILTDVIDWAKSKNTAGTATLARLMDIDQKDLPCMKSNSCYN